MSKFTEEMVNDYAKKLLIGLTKEENEMVLKEFDIINENMEYIANIPNISNVESMTHCLEDLEINLRDDIPDNSPDIKELLQNCDIKEGREVEIPKVVGNE